MAVIHPFQAVICNNAGDVVFAVSKKTVLMYKYQNDEFSLVGKWEDEAEINQNHNVPEPEATKEAAKEAGALKKLKSNDGKTVKQYTPDPLFPVITSQIRNLKLSQDETKLIGCADSDKSVFILDIISQNNSNRLRLIKRQPFPKRPNAIALTDDNKLIIADKFGDVYEMNAFTDDLQQIKEPILGHVSMLTDVLFAKDFQGRKYIITSDRDEHIKISHYPQCFIVDKWLFGHQEFISSLDSPKWKSEWLFSAGGDKCVFAWNWVNGEMLASFDYAETIRPYLSDSHLAAPRFQNEAKDIIEFAVSRVVSAASLPFVAFFVECTNLLIIMWVDEVSGALSLKQTIELPSNIVSLSTSNNEFEVTCDNRKSPRENFVHFIRYDTENANFEVDRQKSEMFSKAVVETLEKEQSVNVQEDDIYPLYNIISLKKHGEHYS